MHLEQIIQNNEENSHAVMNQKVSFLQMKSFFESWILTNDERKKILPVKHRYCCAAIKKPKKEPHRDRLMTQR